MLNTPRSVSIFNIKALFYVPVKLIAASLVLGRFLSDYSFTDCGNASGRGGAEGETTRSTKLDEDWTNDQLLATSVSNPQILKPDAMATPRFYPCFSTRSDGQLYTLGRGGGKELNQPTSAQMDATPKPLKGKDTPVPGKQTMVCDFYKKLDDGDLKAVEWRRKLGGMLMSILAKNDKDLKREFLPEVRMLC